MLIDNAYFHGCEVLSQRLSIVWGTVFASDKSSSHVHHNRGDLLCLVLIVHRFTEGFLVVVLDLVVLSSLLFI